VRQWIGGLPEEQQNLILRAVESASLAKMRKALRSLNHLPSEERGPLLNLEILSTYNLEPIIPVLQFALSCLPSRANLKLGPLDDIESYISQPKNAEQGGLPHARILVWRVEEVLPEALYPFSNGFPEQLAARVDRVIQRVEGVISLHRKNAGGVPFFISTIPFPVNFANPISAAQHGNGVFSSLSRINHAIYERASACDGVYVLDLASWAALEGRTHLDPIVDFLAREPFSAKGQLQFSLFLARSLRPLIVPRRKVLALDLDNTLWGGVVGEDGIDGLRLGHEFPGNVHLRIQRELLELRNRGVLLVLLSKNNEADAREAFDSLPDMLLKWDDFAVRKIDWNHKHENLREAARELGLGLDSFAFLDDSDYEREQIRQFVPEALVLNDSPDPLHTLRCLWETDAFDSLVVTQEDRQRHHDYAIRAARDVERHRDDLDTFLQSLEIEATIEEIGPSNMERVVAMLGKTNQFNLTTKRHSRPQVQSLLDSPGSIGVVLRLRDKFGDQGIVGVLIAVESRVNGSLIIDSFLVSCRALGRGLEDALWAAMLNRALQRKTRRLEAEYIPTAKNGIVNNLYDRLGLSRTEENGQSRRYVAEPIPPLQVPRWITLKDSSYGP
jgi:FkbH-like protein